MVQDKGVWQLFVEGEMQINARWPNAFWDEYSTQSGGLQTMVAPTMGTGVNETQGLTKSGLNAIALLNIGN